MRILFALLMTLISATAWAENINIYRNSRPYVFNVNLPSGTEFYESGIDRKAHYGNIDINFRLIQDHYRDCESLVNERVRNRAKDGYENRKADHRNSKDCSLLLINDESGKMASSFYIWQKRCQCFSAIHFEYPSDERDQYLAISQGVVSSLRDNNYGHLAGQVADFRNTADEDYVPMTCDEKRARGYVLEENEIDYCGGPSRSAARDASEPQDLYGQDSDQDAAAEREREREEAAQRKAAEEARRTVTFVVINKDPSSVGVTFFSQNRRVGWPSWDRHWTVGGYETQSFPLSCQPGEQICMGAWEKSNVNSYWGVGAWNKHGCNGCCAVCGSGTSNQTLLPGDPAPVASQESGNDAGEIAGAIVNGLTLGLGVGSAIINSSPPPAPSGPVYRPSGISQ